MRDFIAGSSNCTALTDVYLPASIKIIEQLTFYNFSEPTEPNLTIHFAGTEEHWNNIVLGDNNLSISSNPNFKINYNAEY